MKAINNNIETLPTDIISLLMFLVLDGCFEKKNNLFVAWAMTQRPAAILSLLEGLSVRARCRDLLCGSGNLDAHFTAIATLVRIGHFTPMVANFIVRNLYMVDYAADVVEPLLSIYQHPEYKNGLAAALSHVKNIYTSAGHPEITTESTVGVICHIHASENKMMLLNGYTGARDCLLCTIDRMFNVFLRGRPKMLASSG
ncbi:hypothetical protein POM88_041499 [Heracleum sosnowskyi]|uniref:Uncharacterized protein n=1 Tax=Heracleum sosnowskyi TaxID=360622 RepID=A0AAD8HGR9_9APIA|nr:hypothetical protein POM88_041499 [Heracleum sosnowskyi]